MRVVKADESRRLTTPDERSTLLDEERHGGGPPGVSYARFEAGSQLRPADNGLDLRIVLRIPSEVLDGVAERVAELLVQEGGDEPEGFIDSQGAAKLLGCSVKRIHGLTSAGRIPHYKDGRRLLFLPSELVDFVRDGGSPCP